MDDVEVCVEVWVIYKRKEILVTDFPGPPADVCSFVSEEAAKAAQERGWATVSEIGFPADCRLGPFHNWQEALAAARVRAEELGYWVVQEESFWTEDEWEGGP